MIRVSYVLVGLLLLCVACNSQTEKETPNGFKYKVVKAGDGKCAAAGQLLAPPQCWGVHSYVENYLYHFPVALE